MKKEIRNLDKKNISLRNIIEDLKTAYEDVIEKMLLKNKIKISNKEILLMFSLETGLLLKEYSKNRIQLSRLRMNNTLNVYDFVHFDLNGNLVCMGAIEINQDSNLSYELDVKAIYRDSDFGTLENSNSVYQKLNS